MKLRSIFFLMIILSWTFFAGVNLVRAQENETEEWQQRPEDPIGALYNEATDLYKQHRYVEAREKFLQVQAISPEAYPSSKAFLRRIDQHVAQQEADLIEIQRKEEIAKQKRAERLQELKASRQKQFTELKQSYRQDKVKKQKLDMIQKKRAEMELIQKARARHKNALALYKAKRYSEAEEQLQLLRKFLTKHELPQSFSVEIVKKAEAVQGLIERGRERDKQKEAEKQARLIKINEQKEAKAQHRKQQEDLRVEKKLAKERKEAQAREYREREQKKEALLLAKQKELKFVETREKIKKEVRANKDIKKEKFAALLASPAKPVGDKLNKPIFRVSEPKKERADSYAELQQMKDKLNKEVEALYQDGAELYQAEKLGTARNIFAQVDKLWPNYKSTRTYLRVIDRNLNNKQTKKESIVKSNFAEFQKKMPSKSREELIKEALDAHR